MKTAELTGAALAYWVHKANGTLISDLGATEFSEWMAYAALAGGEAPLPLDWATCGPIIERDKISVIRAWPGREYWVAMVDAFWERGEGPESNHKGQGPTPLIAAMRAKVASVYGEEVPDA